MKVVGLRPVPRVRPGKILCRVFAVSLVALAVCFPLRAQTSANAISKDKLIALRKAGVGDSVLIEQIRKDGIGFDMNADTTLELKAAGFSNNVLQALLQAGSKAQPAPSAEPAKEDSVAGLYKAGRFPELADRLKDTLRANPSDYKTQALLILTLLKMKENDAAHAEFQQLAAHNQDPAAAPYFKQVKDLLDSLQATEEAKQKLIAAMKDDRAADAYAVVDQFRASTVQKEILKIDLDMYEGKFDQARDRFSTIPFSSYSEKERSGRILENINATEAAYRKLTTRIEVYLHSGLAPVWCSFPLSQYSVNYGYGAEPDLASLSAQEFVGLVESLTKMAPFSDEVANLRFLATLVIGNYDELERLGDHLLHTRGKIEIPFYDEDHYFNVVIDSSRKHIYTEPDAHPFLPKWPIKDGWGRNVWLKMEPFDLSFDQIRSIQQKAGGIAGGSMLTEKAYALKFEPNGMAPNYALMNILLCSSGEKAEMTVTRNLGQYIIHVTGNNSIKSDLADPSKAKGAPNGLLTGLLMAGVAMSSNPAVRDAGIQGLATDQAQQTANYQAQQAAFSTFANQETFDFVDEDAYTGLEELLGVLN